MKKFEYKYLKKLSQIGEDEAAANFTELQVAGDEGWEVVTESKDYWLLMRERTVEGVGPHL